MTGHRRWTFAVDTDIAPDRVMGALTDFTDRRPKIFPNLSKGAFKVYEVGPTSARVHEGTGPWGGDEHYDWSEPGVVRSTLGGSNIAEQGLWEWRVTPREGGGAHIEVVNDRTFTGLNGLITQTLIDVSGGARFFEKNFKKTLELIGKEPTS